MAGREAKARIRGPGAPIRPSHPEFPQRRRPIIKDMGAVETVVLALLKQDILMDVALGSAETADYFWLRGTRTTELESVPRREEEEAGPAEGILDIIIDIV